MVYEKQKNQIICCYDFNFMKIISYESIQLNVRVEWSEKKNNTNFNT